MLMTGVEALPGQTIEDMVAAHEDLARRWRRLDQRTGGFRAPAHACQTWRQLYALCDRLHVDWQAQVDLENRMLLAGRTAGLRNDTEASVAHAQRP
jgi:iron-sulfur cluster repair protein YtfE (RIC family)